ncbi:hypothetical protein SBV1_3350003 [Verrucomicrobia bacterium]|nr:hypothetical protein SBV1_3350003 [Verrucomicrobiota bacterium]
MQFVRLQTLLFHPTTSEYIRPESPAMTETRKGKIARLPHEIRERLNGRLQNGEPGKPLAEWLNSLPEVRAILAAEFGGKRVREQNLSEWKRAATASG